MKRSIIVNVDQENGEFIPYRNNYFLSSHLYHRITNSGLISGESLHDRNEWSPYTVSKILPTDPDREFTENGIKSSIWTFIVRSVNDDIIQTLRGSFALDPSINVGKATGRVTSIKDGRLPDFDNTVKFKTLSPVMIKNPKLADGDKKIIGPKTEGFEAVVCRKIEKSYEIATHDDSGEGVEIWIDDHSKTQVRVSHDEDTLLPAWELEGHMRGKKEVLLHAYHGGIGSKTALGLGCWEVVE